MATESLQTHCYKLPYGTALTVTSIQPFEWVVACRHIICVVFTTHIDTKFIATPVTLSTCLHTWFVDNTIWGEWCNGRTSHSYLVIWVLVQFTVESANKRRYRVLNTYYCIALVTFNALNWSQFLLNIFNISILITYVSYNRILKLVGNNLLWTPFNIETIYPLMNLDNHKNNHEGCKLRKRYGT